jgi:hypothetical protein
MLFACACKHYSLFWPSLKMRFHMQLYVITPECTISLPTMVEVHTKIIHVFHLGL